MDDPSDDGVPGIETMEDRFGGGGGVGGTRGVAIPTGFCRARATASCLRGTWP